MDKLNHLKGIAEAAISRLEQFLKNTTDTKTNVSILEEKKQSLQNKLEEIREQYFEIPEITAQQMKEIKQDIDSANERLKQVEVNLKPLLASFGNKSHIANVNDQINDHS